MSKYFHYYKEEAIMDAKEKEGIEALKRLLKAVQSHDFGTHSVRPIYEFLAGLAIGIVL